MAQLVTKGSLLECSFGAAPSTLDVLLPPIPQVTAGGLKAATTMDHQPMVNIKPFGMCRSLSNPAVASATAAANGTLTPQPCIPVTTAPWIPGAPTVTIVNKSALNNTSKCTCNWGGMISVKNPAVKMVTIP